MPETPNTFTPGPQQEPDDMQVTNLDGSPLGPRTYGRRAVVLTAFTSFITGVTVAAVAPRVFSYFFSPDSSQRLHHENPFPLNPSEIMEGPFLTRLTSDPTQPGLILRVAPDSNASPVETGSIDSVGVYDPSKSQFIGRNWPRVSVYESANTVDIGIDNLGVKQVGQKRWGVLQILTIPILSTDPKVNGTQSVKNVYFELANPSISSALTSGRVTHTDTANLTYHVEHTNGTTADIPIGNVDQVYTIALANTASN